MLKFAICHLSFLVFFTLPYIFINTFLLKLSDDSDIYIIVVYNILTYIFAPLSMHFACFLAKRIPIKVIAQIGIILYCSVYALLIIYMDKIVSIYPIIGVVIGCAAGFYWLCYNYSINILSTDESRDRDIGLITAGYCVISLVCPIVSGAIISNMEGNSGYTVVFIISISIAVLTLFLTNLLPDSRTKDIKKGGFKRTYGNLIKDKKWRASSLAILTMGVREGAIQFILVVMIYKVVSNELLVGINSFASGIGAIISSLLISWLVKPANRLKYMTAAISILFVFAAVFVYFSANQNPYLSFAEIIIIFSVVDGFLQKFITNPVTSIVYLAVDEMSDVIHFRNEYLTIREVFLNAGRGIGALIFLLLPSNIVYMTLGVLIITVSQYLTVYYCKRTLAS